MAVGSHAAIRDHAAIGDGRTVALVARDGTVDWLCLPDLDSASVFGSLLDARAGGSFTLAPDPPFRATQRYVDGTNVLTTTFTTALGTVRVTDAMTLPDVGLAPGRELVRRIEPLAGRVPMRWAVRPRFGYGLARTDLGVRDGVPVASAGDAAIAIRAWDVGEPLVAGSSIGGAFVAEGDGLIALASAHGEPLVLPGRDDVERRLASTADFWRGWSSATTYGGRWRDAVERSVLALKLLVFSPSGAVAGAATTSLPETIGGERNWDYRFSWVRDAAFTLAALLRLGHAAEAEAYFWWLMHASQLSHPRLDVLYRLDGGRGTAERTLPLEGYASSRPVRVGNAAVHQLQLDVYGDLLETAWTYASVGRGLDREIGRRLARIADLVCAIWRWPDAGIWEVRSEPRHFTHSKMMCWVALDRAVRLADAGLLDGDVGRWARERAAIAAFVDSRCWSDAKRSYTRAAGSEELDAAVLLGALYGYRAQDDGRIVGTIDAVERELSDGPVVYRYAGEDGLPGREAAFLPCAFWLVEATARAGRTAAAAARMDALVAQANEVGLYAEELDPSTGAFLGNVPQALTHLALIGAAFALDGGPA